MKFFLLPIKICIIFFESVGRYFLLISKIFRSMSSWNLYLPSALDQMVIIGIKSVPIVIIISLFSGMVTSVQAAYQLKTGLVPIWFVGSIVGESIILELGPMLTGLVMTGSIGATIAAELGTMRVTEQIDALESLSYDPISYLIMPRIVASLIMFPVLVIIADIFGVIGGLIAANSALDISIQEFMRGFRLWFRPWDAWFGLIKGVFFGFAITSIACYKGYYTYGGAISVGKSTTSTVVISCISIVLLDYILAELLL
mgnify:CR=1 FL=1